jgi:precorrin isomerase
VSLEYKGGGWRVLTDEALRAVVSSSLPALTLLDPRGCSQVTAAGVQALRSTTAAPSLHIEF